MTGTLALPMSALELCDAVRLAQPYDAARLDRVLRLDPQRGLIEVQASATWSSLKDALGDHFADDKGTIAEAIATNAPGPDGRPVVTQVESLALVTPDGELRRISRQSHAELFSLAVGGQGLFGAPYSATLRLESLRLAVARRANSEVLELPRSGRPVREIRLLLPPARLEAFLAKTRHRCEEWRVDIETAAVHRVLPEQETVLRWAREEYAELTLGLAEQPALGGAVRGTQLRRLLIDEAVALGGSFPISCTPDATRAQVEACYPHLKSFLAQQRRLDAAGKLSNPWHRHHLNLLGRETCDVRWTA